MGVIGLTAGTSETTCKVSDTRTNTPLDDTRWRTRRSCLHIPQTV